MGGGRPGVSAGARREGAALAAAVMALVVLGALTAVLFVLALHETRLVRARADAARARFAAESGVLTALAGWRTERYLDLAVGRPRPVSAASGELAPGVRHAARVERLDARTYLLRGFGRVERGSDGPAARARVGALVRTVPPLDLWPAFDAALTVGGGVRLSDGARIEADPAPDEDSPPPPGSSPTSCEAAAAAFERLFRERSPAALRAPDTAALRIAAGATVVGEPAVVIDGDLAAPDAFEALGPLTADRLATIADRGADGELDAEALVAPGALTVASGDLVLASGTGAGVLVVLGDLTIRSGARFHGAIYVLGRLVVESDAVVYGAARVASREHASEIDGAIEYAPCALDHAFRASDGLNRPFRPSGRWWVPLF